MTFVYINVSLTLKSKQQNKTKQNKNPIACKQNIVLFGQQQKTKEFFYFDRWQQWWGRDKRGGKVETRTGKRCSLQSPRPGVVRSSRQKFCRRSVAPPDAKTQREVERWADVNKAADVRAQKNIARRGFNGGRRRGSIATRHVRQHGLR